MKKGTIGFMRLICLGTLVMAFMFGYTAVPVFSSDAVTVRIWSTASLLRDPPRQVVFRKFEEENPNVKVKFDGVPWGQFMEKLLTSVAAGNPPDCVRYAFAPRFAKTGVIIPLDDYIKGPEGVDMNEWVPGVPNLSHMWEGKIYGLPLGSVPHGVFYNKDIFEEEGVGPPKIWEEFASSAKKLTKKDAEGKTVRYGFRHTEHGEYTEDWIIANGGLVLDSYSHKAKECVIYNPEAVEALKFLSDLIGAGYGKAEPYRTGMEMGFLNGEFAMWNAQTCDGWTFRPEIYPEFNVGYIALPVPVEEERVYAGHASDVAMIFKDSKHKDLAWKLIKAYTSKEGAAAITIKAYGWIPHYKDLMENPVFEEFRADPLLRAMSEIAFKGIYRQAIMHFHARGDEIQAFQKEEFGAVFRGQKTAEQALRDLQKKINRVIRED